MKSGSEVIGDTLHLVGRDGKLLMSELKQGIDLLRRQASGAGYEEIWLWMSALDPNRERMSLSYTVIDSAESLRHIDAKDCVMIGKFSTAE